MAYNYNKKCLINIPLEPLLTDFFILLPKIMLVKEYWLPKWAFALFMLEKQMKKWYLQPFPFQKCFSKHILIFPNLLILLISFEVPCITSGSLWPYQLLYIYLQGFTKETVPFFFWPPQ